MTIQLIFEFVVGIALLIIIHEMGHFIACRLLKVEVEEFGLGLPPRAFTLFESGGTKFTLNVLPLGGFVRPKGENDPSVEGGLAAANPWVRVIVYFVGPLMNLIVAVLLFSGIFALVGKVDPDRLNEVSITAVEAGSPAEQVGLQVGDLLISLDGQAVTSTDMVHDTIYARRGQNLAIIYQRSGQTTSIVVVPRADPPPGQGAIGIIMASPTLPIGPLEALPRGFEYTTYYTRSLFGMLGRLVSGSAAPQEGRVVGFKGMYDMYATVRSEEPLPGIPPLVDTLSFFASLSLWLGLINLVPIPALDGGRILLVLPEIVIRRRVPPKVEAWMIGVSFLILIALMLFVNLRDFINPATIP